MPLPKNLLRSSENLNPPRPVSAITGRPVPTEEERFQMYNALYPQLGSMAADATPVLGDVKGVGKNAIF